MKQISSTQILGNTPKILIKDKCLQEIKHLVAIAPQEAQWFHTVRYESSNNCYYIEGLYIPEQICSVAEVDSSPSMMVDFYKDLAQQHGSIEASRLLSNMGVWCHSHHNMGVSPSAQDITQFTTMINNDIDQNNLKPQIMIIFNKKNEYYNRLWDPQTDTIWENVSLSTQPYDMTSIENEAKKKFKKKVFSKKNSWNFNKKKLPSYAQFKPYETYVPRAPDVEDYDNEYEEIFCEIYSMNKKYINVSFNACHKTLDWYMNTLHEKELVPLIYFLNN